MIVHKISILGWDKHNKNKKKNHRYFLFDSRFFEDSKISQLRQIEVILFVRCLCIAADLNTNTFQIHKGMLPKGLRIDDKLLQNSLNSLQSFQLLTTEIETPLYNRIEKNRKEYNIKANQISDVSKVDVVEVKKQTKLSHSSGEIKFHRLIDIWNNYAFNLSKVVKTNSDRNRKSENIYKMLKDEEWIEVVKRINVSDFCKGTATASKGWKASYDWLLQKETYLKVIEGKYDNRSSGVNAAKRINDDGKKQIEQHRINFEQQSGTGLVQAANDPTLKKIMEKFTKQKQGDENGN